MEPSPFASSLDSGGECGVVTNTIFPESVTWRALTHGNVHVLMLNSELSVAAGSPQWNFTRDALAAVDRAVTPWSLVFFHRPLYFVSASKSGSGSAGVRDADFAPLEPLFRFEAGADTGQEFVWVYRAIVSAPLNLEPAEIIDGRWCALAELDDWRRRAPDDFTATFHRIAEALIAAQTNGD